MAILLTANAIAKEVRMINARGLCVEAVTAVMEENRPLHLVLSSLFSKHKDIEALDRAFINRITRGTVERCISIDHIINNVSKVKSEKQKPFIRNLLRISAYQLLYTEILPSAACNEAVNLCKKRGFVNLSGFVNGVLRTILRGKEELLSFNFIADPKTKLSAEYSVPVWLIDELESTYSKEDVEQMLKYFLDEGELSIRVNTSKISADSFARLLDENHIRFTRGSLVPSCFRLKGNGSVEKLVGFKEGYFCVQDESSALSGFIAGIGADVDVLDLCAAPGGKSCNVADIILSGKGKGKVTACDVSESKVDLIEDNIRRCGFDNISALVNDATVFNSSFENRFDVVIADVPCSGIGIISKKPDIKYNMTPERQRQLIPLQRDILKNAVRYLKKGGRLVFSTCTLNPEENSENYRYIVEELGLVPIDFSDRAGTSKNNESAKEGRLTLIPGKYGTDGFFMSLFERQS